MQPTGDSGFFGTIAKQFKRFARAFREKPEVKLDDYVLEHFMLYHGLVGTSEENQRQFKFVRADIFEALEHKSATEMAIVLKLPPLSWLEKLETIANEARQQFDEKIIKDCLLPDVDLDATPPEQIPLKHPDWRVRSNAARLIAVLQMKEAVPHLVQALDDDREEMKAGFCHIAYALATLQTPQARLALVPHLKSSEDWFRVDAAGALSHWPLNEVSHDLMHSILQPNVLNDYMSVAIARKHPPAELLQTNDKSIQEGALEIIIGLLQAASGPFAAELGRDESMFVCMPAVSKLAWESPTPRRLRAALMLSDLITDDGQTTTARNPEDQKAFAAATTARNEITTEKASHAVLNCLKQAQDEGSQTELGHALYLAGRFQLSEAAPYLLPLLKADNPTINEVLDATGALGYKEASPQVIALINQLVDLTDRTSRTLSNKPVFEDNAAAAKTYWHALKALGSLPTEETTNTVIRATHDFAPDKREQAVTSLIRLLHDEELMKKFRTELSMTIARALADPAPSVKVAALNGVTEHELTELLRTTTQLAGAKEASVSRCAMTSLQSLAASDHKKQILEAVNQELSSERDQYKRQRLEKLRQLVQ